MHDWKTAIRNNDDYEKALGEIGYDSDDNDLNSSTIGSEVQSATPDDDDDDSFYILINRYSFCI